jgi:hypothetical protein
MVVVGGVLFFSERRLWLSALGQLPPALAVLVAAWGLTHIVLSIRMACPAGRLKVGLHRQRG